MNDEPNKDMDEEEDTKFTTISCRVPKMLRDKLAQRAEEDHRTISSLLVHLVAKHLELPAFDPLTLDEGATFDKALKDGIKPDVKSDNGQQCEKMPWLAEMPKECPKCKSTSLIDNQIPQTWACNDCFAEGSYGEKNKPVTS